MEATAGLSLKRLRYPGPAMNKPPPLTREQFDQVARTFSEVVERELKGEEAKAFVRAQSRGDATVAGSLESMLAAHEREAQVTDDDRFHAAALEAVRAESAAADERIEQAIPETIGPYRVIRFVASGGMSTVYEAEQEEPRRRVAIKVIRLELLTKTSIRRFEAEGHLLAGLRHEGIARVYAMGRTDTPAGQVPYLVLEFVDGMSITDYARSRDLDLRARLELLRRVSAAVQYAHDNGVLHRDLKPGNVFVDAGGNPRVLDFGIARPFDDTWSQAALSASGLFLGTLAYMSPEQAMQTGTPPDVRVDVYGVGAVGYEMLTGGPPHEIAGMPIHEAVSRVVQHAPASLVSCNPEYAGDLSAIFSKALATERERRYLSVREFDEELRRFLEHEPVQARSPSALYRFRMLTRRNRTTFALLTLLLLSLIAGMAIALAQRHTALDARAAAERAAGRANEERRAAELHAAWSALETGRTTDASELLQQAGPEVTGIEWDLLRARAYGSARIREVVGLGSSIVTFSPRGTHAVTRDAAGRIVQLDMATATLRPLLTAPVEGDASAPPFSPGAGYAYAARMPDHVVVHTRDRLTLVDAARGMVVRTLDASAPVAERVDTEDDLFLWRQGPHGTPRLVDLVRGEFVIDVRVAAHVKGLRIWRLLHGRLLLAFGPQQQLTALDLDDMTVARVAKAYVMDARFPVMDRGGRYLLLPYQYPEVHDLETGTTWHVGAEESSVVLDGAFSSDGARLALLHLSGEVRVWDVASRRLVHAATDSRITLRRVPSRVDRRESGAIAFDAQSGAIHTVGRGLAADWPTEAVSSHLNHGVERKPSPYVYDLDWHPEGRWLASAAWDERVVIWDTWAGTEVGVLSMRDAADACPPERRSPEDRLAPNAVVWSPDGLGLAVQCGTGWSVIWDAWSGSVRYAGPLEGALVRLETGGLLVLMDADGALRRVTLEEVRSTHTTFVEPPFRPTAPPAWALDRTQGPWPTTAWGYTWSGSRIAAGRHPLHRRANEFRVWDVDEPGSVWNGTSRGDVLCAQLADDGRRLLLGMRAGTIQIFDVEQRRRLMVIQAHRHYIMALALAPDGKSLASASGDGWIRLWPLTPAAERLRRARFTAKQQARLAPHVEHHRAAADSLERALAALRADRAVDEVDRVAAMAELLRASR